MKYVRKVPKKIDNEHEIQQWCEKNYGMDGKRWSVSANYFDGNTIRVHIDSDYIFEKEADYAWFLLRWETIILNYERDKQYRTWNPLYRSL